MSLYNAAQWLIDRNLEQSRADSVAIRFNGADVTYGSVLSSTWRAQRALRELGIAVGERVVLLTNDGPDMVAWLLGCLRSGVIAIPVSTMLKADDVAMIVNDAEAVAIVASQQYAPMVEEMHGIVRSIRHLVIVDEDVSASSLDEIHLDGIRMAKWSGFVDDAETGIGQTQADSAAFWLYSSGTTGLPKGVMHRHDAMQATYDNYATGVLRVQPNDRFLSVAKLFFAYGLGNSLTFPFGVGATVILEPSRPIPGRFIELVSNERPTLFFASPGFCAALLDTDVATTTFSSVRATVTAGETLPAPLQVNFSKRFDHPVLDGIGSTEALHIFLSNTLEHQVPGSTGTCVAGYELCLLGDDEAEVTEPDTPGYLHVRGPSTAMGYWKRPEVTAAAFRSDGWVRTGDVYTCSSEGYWTFLGRNNDMIKAGGIWVSPAEVEAVLIDHVDVLEAAVVGARNDAGLEEVAAFLVPKAGRSIDATVIESHCRDRMAAYKRPRQLIVVESLPKTATGKIQRFALRDQLAGHQTAD
jgi:benzoate-CoA ligase family protein